MSLKKVSLEVSLKPFCFDMTDSGFAATARKIFHQWENLFSGKQLQLMFWTADGSELFQTKNENGDVVSETITTLSFTYAHSDKSAQTTQTTLYDAINTKLRGLFRESSNRIISGKVERV